MEALGELPEEKILGCDVGPGDNEGRRDFGTWEVSISTKPIAKGTSRFGWRLSDKRANLLQSYLIRCLQNILSSIVSISVHALAGGLQT